MGLKDINTASNKRERRNETYQNNFCNRSPEAALATETEGRTVSQTAYKKAEKF